MSPTRKTGSRPLARSLMIAGALLALVAGCRPATGTKAPRGKPPRATDWRGLSGLPELDLQQRRRVLERQLLRQGPDSAGAARLRHHLSALYLALRSKRRLDFLREADRLDAARKHLGKQAITLLERARDAHDKKARVWLQRAAKQFRALADNDAHRHYRHRDKVLFGVWSVMQPVAARLRKTGDLGRANGIEAVAQRRLVQLLREHPGSPLVPEALLARGDHLRRLRKLGEAMRAYSKVLRAPRADLRPQAQLGLGRCRYAANDVKGALKPLGEAVATARLAGVRDAARAAFFEAWAREGQAARAYPLLQRLARGRKGFARKLLVALAAWCRENGREGLANALFREALRRWPRDKKRCRWWIAVNGSAWQMHDWATVRRGLSGLGALRTSMRSTHNRKPAVIRDCDKRLVEHLKIIATQSHARGRGVWNLAMLGTARRAYEAFGREFPKSKVHYLMAHQHAELLWTLVNHKLGVADLSWEKVATAYENVVRLPRPSGLGPKEYRNKRREAALAVVRSLMKALDIKRSALTDRAPLIPARFCVKKKGRRCLQHAPLSKQPIPALEKRLLRAYTVYSTLVPKSQYRGAVLFNTALMYWRHNHLNRALHAFLGVACQHARDMPDEARVAALRALGIQKLMKRRREYRSLLTKLMKNKRLMEGWRFRNRLTRLRYELLREDAEAHRKGRRWVQCGRIYEKITRTYRRGSEGSLDLWRGARCLHKAHLIGPAIRRYRQVTHRYGAKHRAEAMLHTARLLEQLTFWKRATQWYERFFKQFPNHRQAPRTALRALRFRALLRHPLRARSLLQDIRLRYTSTRPATVAEASWIVLRTPWSARHERKQPAHLERYLKDHRRTGAGDRTLEALVRLATVLWQRSCPVKPTAGRCLATRRARRGQRALPGPSVRRRAAMVRKAKRYLTDAQKLGRGGVIARPIPADANQRTERLRRARELALQARFLLAEMRDERLASPRLPSRFRATKLSLAKWLRTQRAKLRSQQTPFRALLPPKKQLRVIAAPLRIAAAYRIAAPYLALARRLAAWKPTRATARRPGIGTTLKTTHTTLLSDARVHFQQCLTLARRLHVTGTWPNRCQAGLLHARGKRPPSTRARWRRSTLPRFRHRPAPFDLRRGR